MTAAPSRVAAAAGARPARASWRALGTEIVIATQAGCLSQARSVVEHQLAELDLACSRFRDDSELAQVNRAAGRWAPVSLLFFDVLQEALRVARATDGRVDPALGRALRAAGYDRDFSQLRPGAARTVKFVATPGWRAIQVDARKRTVRLPQGVELDLGAVAKAYAADRAARGAAAATGAGVLVNLGGDIAVAGRCPAGGWVVRVTDDHAADEQAPGQTVSVVSGALATSSTTVRRWKRGTEPMHHIIDPQTGRPADLVWRTVSVAAGSCIDANAASTAAIVRGADAPGWLHAAGLPARLVAVDGAELRVGGWPEARDR